MDLLGGNNDLSGGSTQSSPLSAASFITPNSYGLPIQPNTNSQIAIQFDTATGWLAIAGNSADNIVKQTLTGNGYYQFDIDGHLFSSDRSSASYWQSLDGATRDGLIGINFDGGLGYDTLIVGSQDHIHSFGVIADDTIQIQGEVYGESLFFKAKDIINQGSIIAGNVTAEFSDRYTDVADAKIIAIDGGSILLNGGKTSDLEATGQFLATGVVGGKIDFRGKTVSLRGANLDASGENGGGTILIGGDYQGSDPTVLGTLSNSQSTFANKYSTINANALTSGNGGKAIVWSDGDTDFRGNITARGGLETGDGGFVEVSGKQNLNFVGNVDVEAKNGKNGSVLLDPTDIIIEADDHNDSTFDISDLQKINGNITLSATNDIIFNTEAFFFQSAGTISIVAGNEVRFGHVFTTGGRNLNVSAAYINGIQDNGYFSSDYSYSNSPYRDAYLDTYYLNDPYFTDFTEPVSVYESIGYSYTLWKLPSYISTTSYTAKASGNIRLTSRDSIDLRNIDISSSNLRGNAGNIILEASNSISAKSLYSTAGGGGNGGDVRLSAKNNISSEAIRTYNTDGNGKGGNVKLVSTGGTVENYGGIFSGYGFYANAGDAGNAGSVIVDAFGDIHIGGIKADSYSGAGNTVRLTSQQGSIYCSGITTYSFATDGGDIVVKAHNNINLNGEISSYAVNNGGKAGVIKLTANQDISIGGTYYNNPTSNIYASSRSGDGNNISITSVYGGISINGLVSSTSLAGGNAGTITLNSAKDIKVVGEVAALSRDGEVANTGVWNGGAVNITSFGNIETGRIVTSSLTGAGGNIKLLASGESIKVLSTLKKNDIDYSIISSGATKNGGITINRKSGATGDFFAVGDATYNGTKGAIGAGKDVNGKDNSLLATTIVTGTYVDGNIRILTPDIPASSLSNPRTIPPETPTTTYSFAPVSSLNVQGFIDARQYAKAIVALDNLRTIEFYQSQGNTSPTVPQLNSVNQIKNFLNAGDIATGTKSAMIYTFLSGTTQDNPSGTSLNLFAVTSTSDVIYKTIPLVNGQYQGLSVEKTVSNFMSSLRDFSNLDYEDQGSSLYDLIFRPLKDALSLSQVNNLIFSTDSLFRSIPLAALYDKQSSEQNGKFLVEDFSSSVTPSFQVIEKDRYKSLKSANVLKMGATVFGSSTPLPSVRTELENIAQIELQNSPSIRHSPIYLNDQFSSSNLKTLIAKNDAPIVHFSTHGKDPVVSESFVLLGSNNSSGASDRLYASDIRQLKDLSNKDLMVFSTCLSFVGVNYGTVGATLVAGVKSVIGCRWIVSDSATMVAMTGFYQQLLGEGLSKTKALQEAQKSMILGNVKVTDVAGTTDRAELSIKETKVISSEYGQKDIKSKLVDKDDPNLNRLKHPFYWAAFSLVGNPW